MNDSPPLPPPPAAPSWDAADLSRLTRPVASSNGGHLADEDLSFVKNARELIRQRRGTGFFGALPWLALGLVGFLLWWASWAEIEEVTRGIGKVIPSKSVQLIQSLEGGIVEEIYVEEGQHVEKGASLLRIRDAIFASSYKENVAKREVLEARICRFIAEAAGFAPLSFPAHVRPDLAASERDLYEKRRLDYLTMKDSLATRLTHATREQKLLQDGTKSRAVSEVELIRVQKEVAELDGQLRTLETTARREATEFHHKDKADLDALVLALVRDKDRLDRTLIRAPVTGTVNKIYINTVGRVVGSGVDIMEVVPSDDTLLIEANVRPSDIAFIHPGQEATVKFTAYDFSIYGGLKGTLEHIGADTITSNTGNTGKDRKQDQPEESFYPIKVRTATNTLGKDRHGKELGIIPGMVTEVDIITGKKTILTYLLKPLNRARMRALRER